MALLPDKLAKKLSILRNGVVSTSEAKSSKERKEFWSEIMDTAEKPSDRLKASELLGRSEADFTDTIRHGGADGAPIQIQGMNLKGLRDAISQTQAES